MGLVITFCVYHFIIMCLFAIILRINVKRNNMIDKLSYNNMQLSDTINNAKNEINNLLNNKVTSDTTAFIIINNDTGDEAFIILEDVNRLLDILEGGE